MGKKLITIHDMDCKLKRKFCAVACGHTDPKRYSGCYKKVDDSDSAEHWPSTFEVAKTDDRGLIRSESA